MDLQNADTTHVSYAQSAAISPGVGSFFKDEYMTLTFGEYSGRPSDFIDFHKSDLVYFLADGWKVHSVLANGEGGKWTVEARSLSKQTSSGTTTDSDAQTNGQGAASSATSSAASSAVGATANTQEGGPYWFAWSRIRLVRKRLQGDRVAQHMINQLVSSYNEGRSINTQRYDELCRLYASLVISTEKAVGDINTMSVTPESFMGLVDGIVSKMRSVPLPESESLSEIASKIDMRMEAWLDGRRADINRQFDARIEQAKSQMVTNGTYNGVVWPTVASGIERDRQYALNDLNSAIADFESNLAGVKARLFDAKVTLFEAQQRRETGIMEVRVRLQEAAAKVANEIIDNRVNLVNLRNAVAQAMYAFMERRDDDYPDIESVLAAVGQLDNNTIDPGGGGGSANGHDTQTVLPDPTLPALPST